jgi:hypothetical protein
MADYDELRASIYLVRDYAKAEREYGEYARSGNDGALRRAGDMLCALFGKLEEDQQFWTALRRAGADGLERIESLDEVLGQLRNMQEEEEEEAILVELGLAPDQASRLVSDVMNAIDLVGEFLTLETVDNLNSRIRDLRKEVCEAKKLKPKDRKRTVERGLNAAGGAATVAADGAAALVFLPTLASILGGGAMIWNATRK